MVEFEIDTQGVRVHHASVNFCMTGANQTTLPYDMGNAGDCFTGDVATKYVVAIRDMLDIYPISPYVIDTVPDALSKIDASDFLMPTKTK